MEFRQSSLDDPPQLWLQRSSSELPGTEFQSPAPPPTPPLLWLQRHLPPLPGCNDNLEMTNVCPEIQRNADKVKEGSKRIRRRKKSSSSSAESSADISETKKEASSPAIGKKVCQFGTISEAELKNHFQGKKHRSMEAVLKPGGNGSRTVGLGVPHEPRVEEHISRSEPLLQTLSPIISTNCSDENHMPMSLQKKIKSKRKEKEDFAFWCEMCKVGADHESVFKSHMNGKKHLSQLQKETANVGEEVKPEAVSEIHSEAEKQFGDVDTDNWEVSQSLFAKSPTLNQRAIGLSCNDNLEMTNVCPEIQRNADKVKEGSKRIRRRKKSSSSSSVSSRRLPRLRPSASAIMATAPLSYQTLIHMLPIKLHSGNFIVWKTQVQTLLESEDLFGYLDGSTACPTASPATGSTDSDKTAADSASSWTAQDKRLQALLRSTLTEEAMIETIGCQTVREIWLALTAAFDNNSASRELQLRDELHTVRRGTSTVMDFHRRLKGITDDLASLGAPVTARDKSMIFLRALGAGFAEFTAVQLAQTPLPSFANIVAQALSHEIFHAAAPSAGTGEGSDLTPIAFAVSAGLQFRGSGGSSSARGSHAPSSGASTTTRGRGGGFGQSSGGSGGRSSGGSGGSGSRRRNRRRSTKCQLCLEYGHDARVCPNPNPDSANLAETFQSSVALEDTVSDWYLDSGATNHMASSSSGMNSIVPYNEKGHKGSRGPRSM